MKKLVMLGLICSLLLSACAPRFEEEEEVVQESDKTNEKAIIPKYNISESFYRTILPFKASDARGLIAGNINNRLDIDEFETGLMRISQERFPVADYYYQEGQYLDKETVSGWLNRKLSSKQLNELKKETADNIGLNPVFEEDKARDYEEQMKDNPIYLTHILEQNYLVKNQDDKIELGGVSIGLALNSVYYYNLPNDGRPFAGYPREVEIDEKKLEAEGKKIAEEVLKRLRKIDDLQNVPIVISLFKQEDISSIAPGTFLTSTEVNANSSTIDKWEELNEKYHFFPSSAVEKAFPDDHMTFERFMNDIEDFFPNFTGVIGRGFYKEDELRELTITIPLQFYGKAEIIGFTQYVTGLVMEHFPKYIALNVYITSDSGPEAVIVREPGEDEPFVHVYN